MPDIAQIENPIDEIICDDDIARRLRFTKSWVRQQRFRRNNGLAHLLSIDPILFGRSVRYRKSDFEAWLRDFLARRPA